jgi:hypothetical protein
MNDASTSCGHTQRPHDASGTNHEESGTPDLFPPVGDFNAVVPLSEIEAESGAPVTASGPEPTAESHAVRAADAEGAQDDRDETTLVPARVMRRALAFRPSASRPSWPVMIAALSLSLLAGLAAGVYLIKSERPVMTQTPAPAAEAVPVEVAGAAEVTAPHPTPVESESRPDLSPRHEPNPEPHARESDAEAGSGKAVVDSKRVTAAESPAGRVARTAAESPARAPERPERGERSVTAAPRAQREAATISRATGGVGHPPALRTPGPSLPISSPPASTKSKKVIQWP